MLKMTFKGLETRKEIMNYRKAGKKQEVDLIKQKDAVRKFHLFLHCHLNSI